MFMMTERKREEEMGQGAGAGRGMALEHVNEWHYRCQKLRHICKTDELSYYFESLKTSSE